MQNQNQSKLFAFKLAQQQSMKRQAAEPWKVRDGVAIAGCTMADPDASPRGPNELFEPDSGVLC